MAGVEGAEGLILAVLASGISSAISEKRRAGPSKRGIYYRKKYEFWKKYVLNVS
ncbi:MAG: hypothetical protein ACP5K1_02150 [Candidatus Bathyarchaeia archaeon]